MKEYTQNEKDQLITFLNQCITLIKSGVTEYNNSTDTLVMNFTSKLKPNDTTEQI